MEQIPTQKLKRLEKLIENESHIPFTNKLLSDQSATRLNNSWLQKSLNHLLHSDLIEAGEELHFRRLLKAAYSEQLPRLKDNLEKNPYHALIMDLIDQEYDELQRHGSVNALHLLEMACELSRFTVDKPVYDDLLNMIQHHWLEYGSLENLRNDVPPGKRFQDQYLSSLSEKGLSTELDEDLGNSNEIKHFKKVVNTVDPVTGFYYFNPPEYHKEYSHAEVASLWHDFEERVIAKVSNELNNSPFMIKVKYYLWQRQQRAEGILDDIVNSCTSPELAQKFQKKVTLKRPQIRDKMSAKISARPETAEKIYDILDRIIAADMSAFDFLNVFAELADSEFDGAIGDIQMNLERNPGLAKDPGGITLLLRSFADRYESMSSKDKYELSKRQHNAWL